MVKWQYLEGQIDIESSKHTAQIYILDDYCAVYSYTKGIPYTLIYLGGDGWNLTAVIGNRCIFRRSAG